jgi:excisionase family DNA binding protein
MAAQVTVEEAARRLGVSSITIRRRLKRGQLQAIKVDTPQGHQWLVQLHEPDGQADQAAAEAATERPSTPPIEQVPATDALAREIARLEAHNQDLRAQLDDRVREIERLHTILSQTVRALPVPEPQPIEAPDAVSNQAPDRSLTQEATVSNQAPDRSLTQEATVSNHEPGRLGWWPRLVAWMRGA